MDLMNRVVDITAQQVRAVGPRPRLGHEVALRACVGLVPECDLGPYASPQRRQAERELLQALSLWTRQEGGVRPTGAAGGGWTLECQWAGGRGSRQAALDIRPVGGPSSAAMQQLRQWLAAGSIRLPLPSDPSVEVVVPCMACPGELPLGQVHVTLRGLPSAYVLKDAVATILGAVGYTGQPGCGPKLRATEVFRGWHVDEPCLADGSLCAFVDQPEHDPELRRLPASICLGHNQAVIEVLVSSRRASFLSSPPAAAPIAQVAAQPPPPPAHPPPPPPPAPPAAAGGQAWQQPAEPAAAPAPAAMAAAAAVPEEGGAARHMPMDDVQGPAMAAAAAATGGQPGSGVEALGPWASEDALDQACAGRPAMAGQLTEWAINTFGHAASADRVRQLLAQAAAASKVVQGQLQRMAAEQGELNLAELPPKPLQDALVAAFGAAQISAASYVTEDGMRRSARLQPASAPAAEGAARGRSLVRSNRRRSGSRRQDRPSPSGGRARGASAGGGCPVGGRDDRSRSRSRGSTPG